MVDCIHGGPTMTWLFVCGVLCPMCVCPMISQNSSIVSSWKFSVEFVKLKFHAGASMHSSSNVLKHKKDFDYIYLGMF